MELTTEAIVVLYIWGFGVLFLLLIYRVQNEMQAVRSDNSNVPRLFSNQVVFSIFWPVFLVYAIVVVVPLHFTDLFFEKIARFLMAKPWKRWIRKIKRRLQNRREKNDVI